jgi:prophage maintenance system killer protein
MLAMSAFLLENNFELTSTSDALYQFIIDISTAETSFEEMVEWLKGNTKPA